MSAARVWFTAAASAALLSSCASVGRPETQVVIGRIVRTLPAAATESKLGAEWAYSVYEVRPADNAGTALLLAVAFSHGTCPDAENPAQLYRIEYASSRGEIEILFPTYSDFVTTGCERIEAAGDAPPA